MPNPKTPAWEPHGRALMAFFEGRDDAATSLYTEGADPVQLPAALFFRDYEDLPELEQFALELCEGRVLDVGAGAGAHAGPLQEWGLSVTALDVSVRGVEIMRDRGILEVVAGKFLEFSSPNPFDTILLLMNGIGVAGTLAALPNFLLHAKSLLNDEGQILLDSSDLKAIEWPEPKDGRFYGEVRYRMEFEGFVGEDYSWLYVPFEQLKATAETVGLSSEMVYEADEGSYLARLCKI